MKSTLISSFLLLCFATQARCQTPRHFQWFNVGLGLTTAKIPDSFPGLNFSFDYYYLIRKKSTLQFGFSHVANLGDYFAPYPTLTSFYCGYGKSIVLSHAILGVYLAPAVDIGHTSEGNNFFTAGINPTLQAVYHPIFNVGLALEVFGQFNVKQSAVGLRLMLHFNNTDRELN